MSTKGSNPFAALEVVGQAEAEHQETRYQTERPSPQREGIVSDPDQYFAEVPRPATPTPPGREIPSASDSAM